MWSLPETRTLIILVSDRTVQDVYSRYGVIYARPPCFGTICTHSTGGYSWRLIPKIAQLGSSWVDPGGHLWMDILHEQIYIVLSATNSVLNGL